MKKILILALLCSAASGAAIADVPAQFNYQGRLTKQDGSSIVDGEYSVTFTIYDAPEAGNVLWQDINPVTTKEGFFNTIIGAGTNKLDLSGVDFSKSLYLGIRVATDAEMTPRVQLVGVPYAMQAKAAIHADSADNATHADNADSADNADNATNADKLGNVAASQYLTITAGSVKTSNLKDGAVTAAKAPWAPVAYIFSNVITSNKPRIVGGSGVVDGSGDAKIILTNYGFTHVPVVHCQSLGSGSIVLTSAPTTSSFSVKAYPVNSSFYWIAVGY